MDIKEMKKKNKLETVLKKILCWIDKYLFEVILLLMFLCLLYLDLNKDNAINYYGFIYMIKDLNGFLTVLIPFIITIVVIGLSLSSEKIFGLSINEFRELKLKKHYSMIYVIVVSIILLLISFLISNYHFRLLKIYLLIVSVFYMIIFVRQEIPLLIRSKKYLTLIIIDNLIAIQKNIKKETLNLKIVFKNYILENEVEELFKFNKMKKQYNVDTKIIIIKSIHEILFSELQDFIKEHKLNDKQIELLINDLFFLIDLFNDKLKINSNNTYDLKEYLYSAFIQIIRILLGNNYSELIVDYYFSKVTSNIFDELYESRKSHVSEKVNFWYLLLNKIIVYFASNENIKFFKTFIPSVFNNKILFENKEEYFIFFTIYLNYLINIEDKVSESFSKKLVKMLNNETTYRGYKTESVKVILSHTLNHLDMKEMFNLLKELLKISQVKDTFDDWFYEKELGTKSSTYNPHKTISKESIIRWWISIILVFNNYSFNDDKTFIKLFDDAILNENEMRIIRKEINLLNGFGNESHRNNVFDAIKKHSMIFNLKINEELNSTFLNNVFTYMRKLEIRNEMNKYRYYDLSEENLRKGKTNISNALEDHFYGTSFVNDLVVSFKDISFKLTFVGDLTNIHDIYIKSYVNEVITAHLDVYFKNKDKEILDESLANRILNQGFKYRNNYVYGKEKYVKHLNNIKENNNVYTNYSFFYKEDAIKINFIIKEEDIIVRRLKEEELYSIINEKYEVVNVYDEYLYNFENNVNLLIIDEELFGILFRKYLKVEFKFKFAIEFDEDGIILVDNKI